MGYVNFDGKIRDRDGSLIGRMLSGDLAIDNNDNIMGKVYKIGATVLGNDGNYVGRLTAEGTVVDAEGKSIGYLKNKKVAGYALQEVAKNRRN